MWIFYGFFLQILSTYPVIPHLLHTIIFMSVSENQLFTCYSCQCTPASSSSCVFCYKSMSDDLDLNTIRQGYIPWSGSRFPNVKNVWNISASGDDEGSHSQMWISKLKLHITYLHKACFCNILTNKTSMEVRAKWAGIDWVSLWHHSCVGARAGMAFALTVDRLVVTGECKQLL